jgi:hypothetical protein
MGKDDKRPGRKPLNPGDPLVHKGFRLPRTLVLRLSKMALDHKRSESEFLRELLEETLNRIESNEG